LGSAHVKTARKTLVKSTPGVNLTDNLQAAFSYKSVLEAFLYLQFGFLMFWQKNIGSKTARKMLAKLTASISSSFQRYATFKIYYSTFFFTSET